MFSTSRAGDRLAVVFYQGLKSRGVSGFARGLPWKMSQERVLLEFRELVLEDLDYGASEVQRVRDLLVSLDLNAGLDAAELQGKVPGDFDALESQHTRKVNEEFRQILHDKAGLPPVICDRLLGACD